MDNIEKKICCSFCRKSADEVKQLVAGDGIYICDECIDTCYEIVNGAEPKKLNRVTGVVLTVLGVIMIAVRLMQG